MMLSKGRHLDAEEREQGDWRASGWQPENRSHEVRPREKGSVGGTPLKAALEVGLEVGKQRFGSWPGW